MYKLNIFEISKSVFFAGIFKYILTLYKKNYIQPFWDLLRVNSATDIPNFELVAATYRIDSILKAGNKNSKKYFVSGTK